MKRGACCCVRVSVFREWHTPRQGRGRKKRVTRDAKLPTTPEAEVQADE